MQESGYIKKSRIAALVLCFFFGMFGVHRFYLGKNSSAVAMLIITLLGLGLNLILLGWPLLIVTGVWVVIDFFALLLGFGDMREKVYRD